MYVSIRRHFDQNSRPLYWLTLLLDPPLQPTRLFRTSTKGISGGSWLGWASIPDHFLYQAEDPRAAFCFGTYSSGPPLIPMLPGSDALIRHMSSWDAPIALTTDICCAALGRITGHWLRIGRHCRRSIGYWCTVTLDNSDANYTKSLSFARFEFAV